MTLPPQGSIKDLQHLDIIPADQNT